MTALGLCLVYPAPQADAGFNWGRVMDDVVSVVEDDSDSRHGRHHRSGRHRDIALDGTYYRGEGNGAYHKNHDVISVNHFTLSHPSVINLHMIAYDKGSFEFNIYDEDEYKIGDRIYVNSSRTKDAVRVLEPGRYRIDIAYSGTSRSYGEYKFKVNQTPFSAVTEYDISRPEMAYPISGGTEIINYFTDLERSTVETQYYKFGVRQTGDVRVYCAKVGGDGTAYLSILDEDERVINKFYSYNGIVDKTVNLPPGNYYVKVERGNKHGVVYQMRISG